MSPPPHEPIPARLSGPLSTERFFGRSGWWGQVLGRLSDLPKKALLAKVVYESVGSKYFHMLSRYIPVIYNNSKSRSLKNDISN